MDPQDAEARIIGGAAIGRERCSHRKLWALLLTHTLLTGACIACCIFTLQRPPYTPPSQSEDSFIYLRLDDQDPNNHGPTLNFTVSSSQRMELHHGSELKVQHPGPYILYFCVSLWIEADSTGTDDRANLTLKQGKRKTSIELKAEVDTSSPCVRHERLISLYDQDRVTFNLYQKENQGLNLKVLRIGLHYLGRWDFESPDE